MSDGRVAPAGWYPDPSGADGRRWWDGGRWTEHVAPAAPVAPVQQAAPVGYVAPVEPVTPPVAPVAATAPAAAAPAYASAPAYVAAPAYAGSVAPYGVQEAKKVPAGTPVDTVWIWLLVALPVLAIIPLFLWDFEGYMVRSMSMPGSISPVESALGPYSDPAYLTLTLLSWLVYGVSVWFAFLDSSALKRLGYERRFHWAWAFLSSLVYVIGRSVVVRKQAGRGFAPMWAAIAVAVALTIAVTAWTVVVISNSISTAIEMYPSTY